MKISSFANAMPVSATLRAKRNEGEGGGARQQYDPNQTRKDQGQNDGQPKRQPPEPFDPKLIDAALESFASDAVTQQHGMSATVEGQGPGLRISLKDCNGTTLRQFSGEEFLKLREATAQPSGARGKILDQKL